MAETYDGEQFLTPRSMKTSHAYKITAVAIAPHCPLGVSLSNILTKTQH